MTENQFSLMIKDHVSSLYSHAMRYTRNEEDAHDLVQDTMLKAIKFYSNYTEGTNIKGWLFVILRNTFINDYRRNQKKNALIVQSDEISSPELMVSATSNKATGSFVMDDIGKAMKSLPEAYSKPFILYFEGHKYHEIAEYLDIPIGTVKTRIHVARDLLKKYLKTYREA